MGQAVHGCCSGSRPAPAGAARPAAARCCSGLLQPARVRCSGVGKRAKGASRRLHKIADLRCSDEIYARLLHAAPSSESADLRRCSVALPPRNAGTRRYDCLWASSRGERCTQPGAAAVCSGEPEQTGLPGATDRPHHTPLTCSFPWRGTMYAPVLVARSRRMCPRGTFLCVGGTLRGRLSPGGDGGRHQPAARTARSGWAWRLGGAVSYSGAVISGSSPASMRSAASSIASSSSSWEA